MIDEVGNIAFLAGITYGAVRMTGSDWWWLAGILAISTYHINTMGFFYELAYKTESDDGNFDDVYHRPSLKPRSLRSLPSYLLGLTRSMDVRPHAFAIALILNVVPVLLGIFAVSGLLSTIWYFLLKFRNQDHTR